MNMTRHLKLIICFCVVLPALLINTFAAIGPVDRIATPISGFNLKTPPDNKFKIAGDSKEFILLDQDSNGNCLIMAKDFYGIRQYDPDDTIKFDPQDKNNLAFFLNNDFLTSGNTTEGITYQLPKKIVDYIDKEKTWTTEPGPSSSNAAEAYEVKAGVVVLSQTEWQKYITKFGDGDTDTTVWGYWLRTARGKGSSDPSRMLCALTGDARGTTGATAASKYELIRPVFYLKKAFFKEVKLDASSTGLNVKAMIKKAFAKANLAGLYQSDELSKVFSNLPPSGSDVNTIGFHYVGQKMVGLYTYHDTENDKEQGTKYRWLRAVLDNKSLMPINGEVEKEYTITDDDMGCSLYFEVTPANRFSTGAAVLSPATKIIKQNYVPVASAVTISGEKYTGEKLIGDYLFDDKNEELEKDSTYRWFLADKEDGEYVALEGEGSCVLTVPRNAGGKYIKFEVIPRSDSNVNNIGKPVLSQAFGPIKTIAYADVSVKGTAEVGETLSGDYTYHAAGGEGKNDIKLMWMIGTTQEGQFARINNADKNTYTIKPSDFGRYIRFAVQPPQSANSKDGKLSMSPPFLIGAKGLNKIDLAANTNSYKTNCTDRAEGTLILSGDQVQATIFAEDIDFLNNASFTLNYDSSILELLEVEPGFMQNGFKLVLGEEGKKRIFLADSANMAGAAGRTVIATLKFKIVNHAAKEAAISIDGISLGRMGSNGVPTSSDCGIITVDNTYKTFKDISEHPARAAIEKMAEKRIVNGIDLFHFNPNKEISRAEFIACALRAMGIKTIKYTGGFLDVNENDWYANVIETANTIGLIKGSEGQFRPADSITFGEAEIIINRMSAVLPGSWACEMGQQKKAVSRAEAAVIFSKLVK